MRTFFIAEGVGKVVAKAVPAKAEFISSVLFLNLSTRGAALSTRLSLAA